jgi:hypothetical protein
MGSTALRNQDDETDAKVSTRATIPVRVRLLKHVKIDPVTGCWMWQRGKCPRGYGKVAVRLGPHQVVTRLAHRVSYEEFVGHIPDGLVVRHLCHVPGCVNPEHLAVGTQQDNADDAVRAGRFGAGRKLTLEARAEMVRLIDAGMSFREAASRYGLHPSAVRTRWRTHSASPLKSEHRAINHAGRDEARRMRDAGHTYAEIGEKLGICAQAAWRRVQVRPSKAKTGGK